MLGILLNLELKTRGLSTEHISGVYSLGDIYSMPSQTRRLATHTHTILLATILFDIWHTKQYY